MIKQFFNFFIFRIAFAVGNQPIILLLSIVDPLAHFTQISVKFLVFPINIPLFHLCWIYDRGCQGNLSRGGDERELRGNSEDKLKTTDYSITGSSIFIRCEGACMGFFERAKNPTADNG